MPAVWPLDWEALFIPSTSPLEVVLRGTAVYLGVFVLLRVILKREVGSVALPDLLLLVLIADAAQNAMAAEYRSLTEGLLLVGTLIGWSVTLDWLAYRYPFMARLIQAHPLTLVMHGRVLRKNLDREMITMDDLQSRLRHEGIDDVAEVERACLESDGQISVIKRDPDAASKPGGGKRRPTP